MKPGPVAATCALIAALFLVGPIKPGRAERLNRPAMRELALQAATEATTVGGPVVLRRDMIIVQAQRIKPVGPDGCWLVNVTIWWGRRTFYCGLETFCGN